MAFQLQAPGSTRRILRPGSPTSKMIASGWTVLDVLGNPWDSDVASAARRVDERFVTYPRTQDDRDWLAANACPPEFEESTDVTPPRLRVAGEN